MKNLNNSTKAEFKNKIKVINGFIHIDSISSSKVMASNAFDSITIDLQHGMLDFEKCRDIIQTINNYKVFPIVRVPNNDIGIINKVIDAGAFGIICPLINNKNDVDKFTDACYYPPKGIRSYGPTLVGLDYKNYFHYSNSEIMTIAMVETKESVANLNEILANNNLDMIYIGPWDLSISYGYSPEQVFEEKTMIELYKQIMKTVKSCNKKIAIHCSGADIGNFFLKMGFDMVTISTDLNILNKGLQEELNKIK